MILFRSRLRVVGLALAFLLLAAGCGDSASDDPVVEVGGASLTLDDIVDLVNGARASTPPGSGNTEPVSGALDKTEAAGSITTWLRAELWYSELAEQGFEVTDAALAGARAELEDLALNDPTVPDLDTPFGQAILRSQALPEIVAAYLAEDVGAEPVWPVQLCSAHILLESEEDADAVVARLDAGEDFGAVAVEVSVGPSGPSGGELGCVDPASFDGDFVAGAAAVEAPGVSGPVQSQFGWHVIRVDSFDATVSDDPVTIQNALFSTPEFSELQEAALSRSVSLDEAYGTWDASQLAVIAPVG